MRVSCGSWEWGSRVVSCERVEPRTEGTRERECAGVGVGVGGFGVRR